MKLFLLLLIPLFLGIYTYSQGNDITQPNSRMNSKSMSKQMDSRNPSGTTAEPIESVGQRQEERESSQEMENNVRQGIDRSSDYNSIPTSQDKKKR